MKDRNTFLLEAKVDHLDGAGIKYLRDKLGKISQEAMARQLGVSGKTVFRWEKDETRPRSLAKQAIIREYGKEISGDNYFDRYLK